jgi:tRNA (mo5U34)-methyltransferase
MGLSKEDAANRHQQRYRYFFEPLLELCGGSLKGHRVLDLGCNVGAWSLTAAEAGADFILGVDGREVPIDKANARFEAAGVDRGRYRFEVGNILDLPADPSLDVVLCLGVLYHVAKPVELFEVMREAKVVVIDTEVSLLPGSAFAVGHEETTLGMNAIDYELILWPTRQAVIDLAQQFGFDCVPLALDMTDERGMRGYTEGHRFAFICAKGMDLSGLPRGQLQDSHSSGNGRLRSGVRELVGRFRS